MYVVAGEIIEAISGASWESFVHERILTPLGMNETLMVSAGIENLSNVAMAHDEVDATLRVLPYPHIDEVGPTGSMQSNIADMARWLTFMLDSARVDNKRLLKPATYAELFQPQMLLKNPPYPAAKQTNPRFFAYGLSWFLQDYRGQLLAMHTGSIAGMSALVGLLPEEHLGIVVLANRDHAELRHAFMYEVFDRYLGKTDKNWSEDLFTLYDGLRKKAEAARQKREGKRVADTSPTLSLENYTGIYADSLYGVIKVGFESSKHVLNWIGPKRLIADLKHWHYDTFKAVFRDQRHGEWLVQFRLDANGRISELELFDFRTFRRVEEAAPEAEKATQ